jgi:hypothetical protein
MTLALVRATRAKNVAAMENCIFAAGLIKWAYEIMCMYVKDRPAAGGTNVILELKECSSSELRK